MAESSSSNPNSTRIAHARTSLYRTLYLAVTAHDSTRTVYPLTFLNVQAGSRLFPRMAEASVSETKGVSGSVSPPIFTTRVKKGGERSKRHHRNISYGTFVPFYVIDSEYLKSLLYGNQCELNEPASAKSAYSAFPPSLVRQRSSDSDQSLSNSEPAILYSSVNGYYEPDFFSECELQVKKLFVFMELHLSKLEDDLAHVVKRREVREEAQDEDEGIEGDLPEKSKLLDSGIEEDHMQTEMGILRRLRDVGVHLMESLQNSIASLDELVQVHDDTHDSTDGRDFLQDKLPQRDEFASRLNTCVSSIDSEMERYNQDVCVDGLDTRNIESKVTTQVRATPIPCFTYFHGFLLLCIMAAVVLMYYTSPPTWVVFLRLIRSPILVVMYFYLLGINMKVWATVGIDYVSIFKYPSNGTPTPKYAFKVAGIFVLFFGVLFIAMVTVGAFTEDTVGKVITVVMWLSLLGFVINPLNVYLRRGRISFILVWVRILLAPFHFVYFGDFWFADQLNSTVAILLDAQYFICYVSEDTWSKPVDERICTSSTNGIRPIVSCLPALWRFFQCLRCFYDTRQIKHLINAGKYSTTFPVVLFAALFSAKVTSTFSLADLNLSHVGWIVVCWIFFSVLHTVYTFIWDIYCDWGLLQLGQRTLLRPHRLYRWTFVYYIAIFVDFVLRCAWVVKLTLAIVWHLDSDLLYTGLVIGEIMRRFIWNFFRVEFEQVCRRYPD